VAVCGTFLPREIADGAATMPPEGRQRAEEEFMEKRRQEVEGKVTGARKTHLCVGNKREREGRGQVAAGMKVCGECSRQCASSAQSKSPSVLSRQGTL